MSVPAEQVESKSTTMAALKPAAVPEMHMPEVAAGFTSLRAFELLQRAGKALANSSLVPQIYQGNLPNCIIALEMAQRIGASPLMVMQNLYIVYNRPAWSAKFLIACFNQCGRFSAVRYIWSGTRGKDDWGCQAWSIEKETGEKILGPVITLQLAKDEGWYGRKDSKWKTMPEKMFMYRAAAWMIDTHAPELSMGIRTDDETQDTFDATREADGRFTVTTESLRAVSHQVEEESGESGAAFDIAAAVTAIKGAKTLKELDAVYTPIVERFVADNQGVPIQIETAFGDHKSALEQAE